MSNTVRGLSLFALTMIAIGSTIGSGIFQTPSSIAREVNHPGWIVGLWIAGGVVSLLGALVFAELGARVSRPGGVYAYLHEAWGALPAFLYGWSLLAVVSSGTIAALIIVFADYMDYFFGFGADAKPFVAAGGVVLLTLFNTFGIKSSEWFANISTVIKIVGIYAVLAAALFLGKEAIFGNDAVTGVVRETPGTTPLAIAFVGVLWSYTGWHYASFVSGEARNPKRNVPIAMVLGTAAVTLTYVLTNLGYMSVLDLGSIQQSEALAADVMEKVVPGSGNAVAVLIAISVFGCAGLYILATPRIIQQMSSERLFFPAFAKSHPKFGVPLNAILLQSAWAMVLVFFWGKFEALYTYVTTTEWLFLMAAAAGIFVVRSRQKEAHTGFSVPLYPVVPALFCLVVGWFIYKNAVSDNPAAYYGLLVIPIGALVYFIFRKSNAA